MRILCILFLALSLACCKSESPFMSDHFNKPIRGGTLAAMPSAFSVKRAKRQERSSIPGGFSRTVKNRDNNDKKKHKQASDPFSRPFAEIKRDAHDLDMLSFGRKRTPKNFIGERFRLFSRDPNASRKRRIERKKNKKDAKKQERRRSTGGQMDLFQHGVLPKMKSLR